MVGSHGACAQLALCSWRLLMGAAEGLVGVFHYRTGQAGTSGSLWLQAWFTSDFVGFLKGLWWMGALAFGHVPQLALQA